MAEDNVKFIDAEQYQGLGKNDTVTFKDLIMRQLAKISINANCEFRGGYWEERPVNFGNMGTTAKVYVPDSREIYSHSVEFLYDLVYPHADEELRKAGEKCDEEIEKAFKDNTVEKTREEDNYADGKKEDRKFRDISDRQSYRSAKVTILKKLFREISCFLKRVDYFDGKSYSEEV